MIMKAEDKVLKFIDRARDSDDLEKLGWIIKQTYLESQNEFGSLNHFVNSLYVALQSNSGGKGHASRDFNRHAAIIQMEAEFPELLLSVA